MPERTEHALELWARAQELLVLVVRAEAHHVLDAGAVVPAAVEQDHLACRGQVCDVTLEVPLRPLALPRRGPGPRRGVARVQAQLIVLIAPPFPAASRPSKMITTRWPVNLIHSASLTQLDVKSGQLGEVLLVADRSRRRSALVDWRIRKDTLDVSPVDG